MVQEWDIFTNDGRDDGHRQKSTQEVSYELHGQEISSRLEMSPKRKPLTKAHALFYKGFKTVDGDESTISVVYGKIQISFFVGGAMSAKFSPEGDGLAGEDWNIIPEVILKLT